MGLLTPILALRNNPRILKLPPYLSLLCIVIGLAWLLVLPLNEYSRRTYISENALLPGQVHTYFGGSEHNVFRAYRHEVAALAQEPGEKVAHDLGVIFKAQGLKVGRQKYSYEAAGKTIAGENVYAMLQGPRADATEAIVLIAAWRNMDGVLNQSGVALVLTLARYFKRWSLWSKDIFLVITEDSTAGPQAWVDAYHSTHDPTHIADLPIKGGALQGALAIDFPASAGGHRFDKLHVIYDGANGQLPNLDLMNTVVTIASGHMGVGMAIQRMWRHKDTYAERLETMFRGMLVQGLGHATGPHSAFIPYHVDAITLQTVGDGWHDEITLGRVIESTFRSLNNLLEHLHQSFFFYLVMHTQRFVSIGTYLPSAMLVAVNFAILSIALWVQSGRPASMPSTAPAALVKEKSEVDVKKGEVEVMEHGNMVAVIPKAMLATEERMLFLPVVFVALSHFLGLVPFYIFNNTSSKSLPTALHLTALTSLLLPLLTAHLYTRHLSLQNNTTTQTRQTLTLIPALSLLLLSISLSTLSTLNFPLSLITGLLASPLTLTHSLALGTTSSLQRAPSRRRRRRLATFYSFLLHLVSPTSVLYIASVVAVKGWTPGRGPGHGIWGVKEFEAAAGGWRGVEEAARRLLVAAAEAWWVTGTWTAVVVWLVWWPAWFVGQVMLGCDLFAGRA